LKERVPPSGRELNVTLKESEKSAIVKKKGNRSHPSTRRRRAPRKKRTPLVCGACSWKALGIPESLEKVIVPYPEMGRTPHVNNLGERLADSFARRTTRGLGSVVR